jgi:hypothetical protein
VRVEGGAQRESLAVAPAWVAGIEGEGEPPRPLWAGYRALIDLYPAQNVARRTKSPSTVDFVKRTVQTLPSMREPRSPRRQRPS